MSSPRVASPESVVLLGLNAHAKSRRARSHTSMAAPHNIVALGYDLRAPGCREVPRSGFTARGHPQP